MNVSLPTSEQLVHGIERTAIVFVLAVGAYLKTTADPLSKASLSAAGFAGIAAIYQLVLSTFTNL